MLANDDIEVAYPILAFNKVLQDADLIEVIRHRTLEHQLVIAIREDVSEAVSDALVRTGKGTGRADPAGKPRCRHLFVDHGIPGRTVAARR